MITRGIRVERLRDLDALRDQLPSLRGRARERTLRAIRQAEIELAPGRAAFDAALRRLDARADR